MFDGVFDSHWDDWQRDEPRPKAPRAPWPLIVMLVAFAMFSIAAALTYPEVFAAGLERF
jgi:hypothetical protein